MRRLIEKRYIIRHNAIAIIGFCLCFYFSYHALLGERSLLRLMTLERQIAAATQDYERAHEARVTLEDRVVRLRPGSIDPDLLEERARYVLGYVKPGDQIIIQSH